MFLARFLGNKHGRRDQNKPATVMKVCELYIRNIKTLRNILIYILANFLLAIQFDRFPSVDFVVFKTSFIVN